MILLRILIMGLPNSGKTWLAKELQTIFQCAWFNADDLRRMSNDWDFSEDARLRQAKRMKNISDFENNHGNDVICDFVCPTDNTRKIFDADYTIWMDTIKQGRYEDTNNLFKPPSHYDLRITTWITQDLLRRCLEDTSHGMMDTKHFLSNLGKELDRC